MLGSPSQRVPDVQRSTRRRLSSESLRARSFSSATSATARRPWFSLPALPALLPLLLLLLPPLPQLLPELSNLPELSLRVQRSSQRGLSALAERWLLAEVPSTHSLARKFLFASP